jgi:hypothetical protein
MEAFRGLHERKYGIGHVMVLKIVTFIVFVPLNRLRQGGKITLQTVREAIKL